jgi:Ca-activated chloride channel family protein
LPLVILVLFAATAPTSSAQPPTFRADASLVPIVATVTDRDEHLVTGLVASDFEVLDNGRAQPLAVFETEVIPIAAVVALDTSASMTSSLSALKYAAEQFVLRLFPHDRARICVFNDRVGISDAFTDDRDDLARAIRSLDYGNATRLYDAIAAALEALRDTPERRVIVVFSDGEDTASHASSGAIAKLARRLDTMVYAIGFTPSRSSDDDDPEPVGPDPILRKLARDTGGGYLEVDRTGDLAAAFTRISRELHSQYVLAIRPAVTDGRVHTLAVRVHRPDVRVRARQTYLAPAAPRS